MFHRSHPIKNAGNLFLYSLSSKQKRKLSLIAIPHPFDFSYSIFPLERAGWKQEEKEYTYVE